MRREALNNEAELARVHQSVATIQKCLLELGIKVTDGQLEVIDRSCPHVPQGLPRGKAAVYLFSHDGQVLKVGKTDTKSRARFLSQHYEAGRARSSLAQSLLKDPDELAKRRGEESIGKWIRSNTRRIDVLIDASLGPQVLNFVEAYLQVAFTPKYEGKTGKSTKRKASLGTL